MGSARPIKYLGYYQGFICHEFNGDNFSVCNHK